MAQYAEAMHGVMKALGYEEYGMSPSFIKDRDANSKQSSKVETGEA